MTANTLDRHWDGVYANGDATASWTQAHPTRSLDAIAAIAPDPDAPVIDAGGGSSTLAGALLTAGHTDVTVLDLSARALALARQRLGDQAERVHWITADVLSWKPVRRYAILARPRGSALLHRARRSGAVRRHPARRGPAGWSRDHCHLRRQWSGSLLGPAGQTQLGGRPAATLGR